MSSFTNLLSRLSFITEAASPLDTLIPGFQKQARGLAAAKGASASTREGKLAFLTILYDLDIIDDSVVRMFKNDPSVSRMVQYLEDNGISKVIKSRISDIQDYIKDKIEDKIGFTTGNRTDAAQQRMEMNRLNNELKATKKAARIERKKDTANAISAVSQVVDTYSDLIGSIQGSYSQDYMLEVIVDKSSDLEDIDSIVKYLKRFVSSADIDIEGRHIDVTFGKDTKLAKLIERLGVDKVESQIADDLEGYGGAGVVIHSPDADSKPDMIGNLGQEDEEYSETDEEDAEDKTDDSDFDKLAAEYSKGPKLLPDVLEAQKKAVLRALGGNAVAQSVTENYVLNYMSEQRVYSTPKPIVESVNFKEKFKPKTAKQLAELKSYGM